MSRADRLFAGAALAIQAILTAYFALRTWSFEAALQVGWVIYAVAIPALIVSPWCPGYGRAAHRASDLTVDRVVPLAAGGAPLDIANTAVLCRSCLS